MRATTLALCLALTACTQFPTLEGTVAPDLKNAEFPELVPLTQLQTAAAPVVSDPAATTQTLQTRVTALRARAARLQRRAIVDPATRRRLEGGFS
ncbi:MAG: hypothetical protein AAF214_05365 [Pseudomonadota bacterium]